MSEDPNTYKVFPKNHLLTETEKTKCPITKLRNKFYKLTGIWDFLDLFPRSWRYYYYDNIKPIFAPCHKELRNSVPRTWMDLSHVTVTVNFQIIKSFYEEEYLDGTVDWEGSSDSHKEFANWLEGAYKYITETRQRLEIERDNSYPDTRDLDEIFKEEYDENGVKRYVYVPLEGTYEERYGKVNAIEKEINDKDTEILIALIKYRDYLWT